MSGRAENDPNESAIILKLCSKYYFQFSALALSTTDNSCWLESISSATGSDNYKSLPKLESEDCRRLFIRYFHGVLLVRVNSDSFASECPGGLLVRGAFCPPRTSKVILCSLDSFHGQAIIRGWGGCVIAFGAAKNSMSDVS